MYCSSKRGVVSGSGQTSGGGGGSPIRFGSGGMPRRPQETPMSNATCDRSALESAAPAPAAACGPWLQPFQEGAPHQATVENAETCMSKVSRQLIYEPKCRGRRISGQHQGGQQQLPTGQDSMLDAQLAERRNDCSRRELANKPHL